MYILLSFLGGVLLCSFLLLVADLDGFVFTIESLVFIHIYLGTLMIGFVSFIRSTQIGIKEFVFNFLNAISGVAIGVVFLYDIEFQIGFVLPTLEAGLVVWFTSLTCVAAGVLARTTIQFLKQSISNKRVSI